MIYIIVGASGSGKSTIEKEICNRVGYSKVVSYTTRPMRSGEKNGKDYHFINNETFDEMLKDGLFAEYDEYSQGRKYGTLKNDYISEENKVVVLTPNGLRQLKRNVHNMDNIKTILVASYLGTRIKRYIDRVGEDKFNFDDKNEIAARVERDYGMFLGVEDEVDYIVDNNEGTDIKKLVDEILEV